MRYLFAIALFLVSVTATQGQIARVSIPECAKAPTYDNGINLAVYVITNKITGDHDLIALALLGSARLENLIFDVFRS
jgi:hypothetical protein